MIWNMENGTVPMDGTDMNYVSFGSGEKTLILLPGLSDGLTTVKGKALLLAPSYKTFFKSHTVYIFSRKNEMPENYSVRSMAEDQAKAMQSLGIRKAAVLGASQGGMIAQYLAIDHPELTDKLILAVTTSKTDDNTGKIVQSWIGYAKQDNYRQLMADTAEKSYSEEYLKHYRKLFPLIGSIGKPADYRRFLANANAILKFDCHDELKNIKCPTLIIGGTVDRIVGAEASYEMHRQIPESQIYMYEGLGHAAYEEAKTDFDKRVLGFLNDQPGKADL